MILELQSRLGQAVRAAARAAFDAELATVSFQYPPRLELGDLALTAPFDLAKTLRRKPREVAEALAAELAKSPLVNKAEVAGGGYVNLFLHRAPLAREIHDHLVSRPPAPRVPGRTIVEHTSINPNKAAHVGHLRNSTLGDTFVRVLRHRGHEVGIQNYIDDTGVQVADVVVGFQHLEGKSVAEVEAIGGRFDYYCWDLYAKVGDFYAQDPANKKLQAETLHAIESGKGEAARMGELIARRIVDCHLVTVARLGITYDLLAHESDILRLHFWDRAFELLKASGAIRLETEGKNKGCWVLTMGAEGDDDAIDEDKIIVRSNGTVTYTGKDIAYQLWKLGKLDRDFRYRRYREQEGHTVWTTTSEEGESGAPVFGHADQVFNVIDVGQSYPQRVVKAGVAALGHRAEADRSYHLAYEKVVLSPATARALGYEVGEDEGVVKVSGRKGLGVKADDLVDALVAKAKQEIEARDSERSPEDKHEAASAIAVGALRYFLLKFSRTRIITFDLEEALAFVGETGPYVQNAVVRARNIRAKLEGEGHRVEGLLDKARGLDLTGFLSGEEGDEVWALLMLMARIDEVAEQSVRSQEVALLAKHAFAVAQAFHSYYQKPAYSVLYASTDELRALRLLVVESFLGGMQVLCSLLGIPIPRANVMRPLVGVTMGSDHRRGTHFSLRIDYVRAVEAAGGLAVALPPGRPEDVAELVGRLQGLVLSGGGDLDPVQYGEAAHETVTDVTPERDAFELALTREALLRDQPTLAICRGVQTLNVATGGTLVQDIPSSLEGADDHDPKRERWELAHDVRVLPGSRLRQVLGEDRVAVNSFHHQAVKDVGRGLVASAWSVTDGIVEGLEAPDRRFVLGVQWHPESFWDKSPSFQPLFEALVAAAREPRR